MTLLTRCLLLAVLLVPGLPGCASADEDEPLTEESFMEDFEKLFCDKLEECGDQTCDDATGSTGSTGSAECAEFDDRAAYECLNGDWTCDDTLGFPIPPTVCASVCQMTG